VARWFRSGLAVAAPFVWRCLISPIMLRFHIPLIKPDMQISRIRLSDKGGHAFAHGKLCVRSWSFTSPNLWFRYVSGKRENP